MPADKQHERQLKFGAHVRFDDPFRTAVKDAVNMSANDVPRLERICPCAFPQHY